MKPRIKDIPVCDRPREKLVSRGAAALSDQELLAVLLGKGTRTTGVMDMATQLARIIDTQGLVVQADHLCAVEGVGEAKAAMLLAALEFSRRRIKPDNAKILTPSDLIPHIRHYADRKQEHLLCASINGANEILAIRVISIGLIDRTTIHPREVFADAVVDRASGIILAHNHPAGSVTPSQADVDATSLIKDAGRIMGISLLDHIIFNRSTYYSFLESGTL